MSRSFASEDCVEREKLKHMVDYGDRLTRNSLFVTVFPQPR